MTLIVVIDKSVPDGSMDIDGSRIDIDQIREHLK